MESSPSMKEEITLSAFSEFAKGADIMKLGVVYKADPYLSLRSSPAQDGKLITKLTFNTRVFVQKQLPGNWYFIATNEGLTGYIPRQTVMLNPPEPLAILHKIRAGESAIGIAEQYYKQYAKDWGNDLRFYINVLVIVNGGDGNNTKGIYRERGKDWKDARTRAGYLIWIPSVEFAKELRTNVSEEIVKSGSITYDAWRSVVKGATSVWEYIKFGAAFVAGLVHGFANSIWDMIVGFFELFKGILSLLWSILTLDILSDVKKFWDSIVKLDIPIALKALVDDFMSKWNNEDPLIRAHFRGWIIGYILAEVAMALLSGGTLAATKWASKVEKITSLLKDVIIGMGETVSKIRQKIPRGALQKIETVYNKTHILGEAAAREILHSELRKIGRKLPSKMSEDAIFTLLHENGQLTEQGIQRFVRDLNNYVGQEGRKLPQTITGSFDPILNPGNVNTGFRGTVFEELVESAATKSSNIRYVNLNRANLNIPIAKPNFPVVDALIEDVGTGRITKVVSDATGTPDRLINKIQELFDITIDATGNVTRAESPKFRDMLGRLQSIEGSMEYENYVKKAKLFVPNDMVNPLKAAIQSNVSDPAIRKLLVDAVISEL